MLPLAARPRVCLAENMQAVAMEAVQPLRTQIQSRQVAEHGDRRRYEVEAHPDHHHHDCGRWEACGHHQAREAAEALCQEVVGREHQPGEHFETELHHQGGT